jgi:DNA repair protein RadA/Sms
MPRRVVNGVDSSRVAMLLAVLERRCKIALSSQDVYVSTVGGIRLSEPGADLAIALAIASAVRDVPLPATLAAVGEISLAGEIRPVAGARQRIAEAKRLGYTTVLDGTGSDGPGGSVSEVIGAAFAAQHNLRAVDKPAF